MKQNFFVLIVIIMLSVLTSLLGGMPINFEQFLFGFVISFSFWFLMLVPAFEISKK